MKSRLQGLLTALCFVFMPFGSHAAEVSCQYDNNEEWPWFADRTCQTREPAIGALLGNDPTTSKWPVCASASADPDGDGWGWENNSSCQIAASSVASKFATCTSSSSDPDGDGWGWENSRSCFVDSQVSKSQSGYPDCTDPSSDPDGDGWGWEDGRSCRVSESGGYPLCSAVLVDHNGDGWGYESNQSCKHASRKTSEPTTPVTEPDPVGPTVPAPNTGSAVVFQQNFNAAEAGQYTRAQLNRDWNTPIWHLGFDQGRVHIVPEAGRGNALRVTYPANTFGAAGASAFLSDLEFAAKLPKTYEELYISYDVKFANGFDFVRGGKLPGLCGHDNTQSPSAGCNTGGGFPDGFDGWSARGMWREDGVMENYVYHSAQKNFYGDDEYWGVKALPGQWHQIQHHVVLNTVGKADGKLEAWFDGKKVLNENTYIYRKTKNIGINLFYFSTFYGGNDPSWAPSSDQYIYFDNFRIATTPLPSIPATAAALNDATNDSTDTQTSDGRGGGALGLSIVLLILLRRFRSVANTGRLA